MAMLRLNYVHQQQSGFVIDWASAPWPWSEICPEIASALKEIASAAPDPARRYCWDDDDLELLKKGRWRAAAQ
jgi:hypothetical protein